MGKVRDIIVGGGGRDSFCYTIPTLRPLALLISSSLKTEKCKKYPPKYIHTFSSYRTENTMHSTTNTNPLMLFREAITVYSESHKCT
jgi:hypothetical protein